MKRNNYKLQLYDDNFMKTDSKTFSDIDDLFEFEKNRKEHIGKIFGYFMGCYCRVLTVYQSKEEFSKYKRLIFMRNHPVLKFILPLLEKIKHNFLYLFDSEYYKKHQKIQELFNGEE